MGGEPSVRTGSRWKLPALLAAIAATIVFVVVGGVLRNRSIGSLVKRGAVVSEGVDGLPSRVKLIGPRFRAADLTLPAMLAGVSALELRGTSIRAEELPAALRANERLAVLHLGEQMLSPTVLEEIWMLPQLTQLILESCRGFSGSDVLALAERRPELKGAVIDLAMSPEEYLALRGRPNLRLQIEPQQVLRASSAFRVEWSSPEEATFALTTNRDVTAADWGSISHPERVVAIASGEGWRAIESRGILLPAGLPRITALVNLRSLNIGQPLQDEQMESIGELSQLASLIVTGGEFTDEGLSVLRRLSELRSLTLESPNVRGPGIDAIRSLKQLTSLHLRFENCDPAVYNRSAGLPRLTRVRMVKQGLTDEGLEFFRDSPLLESLDLYGSPLTEEAIPKLEAFPRLTSCDVRGGHIPDDVIERFVEVLIARRTAGVAPAPAEPEPDAATETSRASPP